MATTQEGDTQKARRAQPVRLGETIRRAREGLRLTTRQVAARCGIHHSTLVRVETGEQRPAPEILQKLAVALELDETDLFALAGYRLPEGLPAFPAYLRAKYRMPEEAAQQLNEYFGYLADKYDIDTSSDASTNSSERRTRPKSSDN